MKCTHCGAEIPDDSTFCEHCGKKIGDVNPPSGNFDKKKLAIWIGAAAAAVVVALVVILFMGKGGSPAETPEEIFNRLNAEEHIKSIAFTICEDGSPDATSNILTLNLDNVDEVYIEERNLMSLWSNYDRLHCNTEAIRLDDLKAKVKEFLGNPDYLSNPPKTKPTRIVFHEGDSAYIYPVSQGIVSYLPSSSGDFDEKVRKILLLAVYELRDELSMKEYGLSFRNLPMEYQSRAIRTAIPLAIVENCPPPPPEPKEPEASKNSKRSEASSVSDDQVFTVVETDPEFPGGMEALYQYIANNIQYPQLARDNGIYGKVYLTFVIEKDGRITNIKILRDIGGGCGAEAVRVVKSMPRWTPGKQQGKPVRVQFNLPVNFNLYY